MPVHAYARCSILAYQCPLSVCSRELGRVCLSNIKHCLDYVWYVMYSGRTLQYRRTHSGVISFIRYERAAQPVLYVLVLTYIWTHLASETYCSTGRMHCLVRLIRRPRKTSSVGGTTSNAYSRTGSTPAGMRSPWRAPRS